MSRRQFLASLLGGCAVVAGVGGRSQGRMARASSRLRAVQPGHLAWVWQFDIDGEAEAIASVLVEHGLGVALKTHDGTEWMSEYDDSPDAVTGPRQVAWLAHYFEAAGVPFHAWCVVKGNDPVTEAMMCAQVLAAGARSIIIDLEAGPGFWQGTTRDAVTFGDVLRRLQPYGVVKTVIDPRPWLADQVPLDEFAAFSDGFMPMIYWESFKEGRNPELYVKGGWLPDISTVTPEFLLDVAIAMLADYDLPVEPIGEGSSADMAAWERFVDYALGLGTMTVSAWRFGTTGSGVWRLLKEKRPVLTAYTVQPGDTLSELAARWRVSVDDIIRVNQITNADVIYAGEVLYIPARRYY